MRVKKSIFVLVMALCGYSLISVIFNQRFSVSTRKQHQTGFIKRQTSVLSLHSVELKHSADKPGNITRAISYIAGVPVVVWAFWFGPPMYGKRLEAWKSLNANIGVPVTLVTDETLPSYNVSSHPMHPAISLKKGLSTNHKADYLRVYFMHHYGGGYHDVKPHKVSWKDSFKIFKDPNVWVLGIPEGGPGDIGCREDYVTGSSACKEVKVAKNGTSCCSLVIKSWKSLVSNGAYLCRPQTKLTNEWLTNIERHLTNKFERIKAHPAPKPRCCQNGEPDYPMGWGEVHGAAFHPMQWKYKDHVKQGLPRWAGGPYRNQASESFAIVKVP